MRNALSILIFSFFIMAGCSSGIRFFVCPYEFADEIRPLTDIQKKKEVLVGSGLRAVIVHLDKENIIEPVEHLRPEHTFGFRTHPLDVSFEKPMTLARLIIIKKLQRPIGIAIKNLSDIKWRIFWLKEEDIKDMKRHGVVYLPPYDNLPLVQNLS